MAWGGGNEEQVRGRGGMRVVYSNFSTSLFMKDYNSDYNTVCTCACTSVDVLTPCGYIVI